MSDKLYTVLASTIGAFHRCAENRAQYGDWYNRHGQMIHKLAENHLPHGAGVDCGTRVSLDESTEEKIVLMIDYHHMNENGMYDGWTEHKAIITPSFIGGFTMRITGRNRNDIKDYLAEILSASLLEEISRETQRQYSEV